MNRMIRFSLFSFLCAASAVASTSIQASVVAQQPSPQTGAQVSGEILRQLAELGEGNFSDGGENPLSRVDIMKSLDRITKNMTAITSSGPGNRNINMDDVLRLVEGLKKQVAVLQHQLGGDVENRANATQHLIQVAENL
ncbi:MAG: DUF4148 domain-containing protein [bacterium]|nr:DUF4148 domain-containing protein [bacterium]